MKAELTAFFLLVASIAAGCFFESFAACVLTFVGIIVMVLLISEISEKIKSIIVFFVGIGILTLIAVYGKV